MTEARVVDFFNLSLLAEVAADIKEQEDREKENHAGIDRRISAIKLHEEEEEEEEGTRRRRRRQVMTTKKRKQEDLLMMPCNSERKRIGRIIRSPTSSSDDHGHGWIEAHVRMRASPPIWICDKRLTDCDTRTHQNRLLLAAATIKDMLIPHLSENQKYQLLGGKVTMEEDEEEQQQTKKNTEGLKVAMIDERGGQWNNMWLKQWATGNYALKGEWTKMVEKNGFVGGRDTVRVYAFKYGAGRASEDQHLGLVVARITPLL